MSVTLSRDPCTKVLNAISRPSSIMRLWKDHNKKTDHNEKHLELKVTAVVFQTLCPAGRHDVT